MGEESGEPAALMKPNDAGKMFRLCRFVQIVGQGGVLTEHLHRLFQHIGGEYGGSGEGVAFSSPVAADSLFRRTVLSNHLSFDGINRTACRPSAGFVACNVLSRYFEGARPFKKFRGTGVVAYLFQVGPDQYAAAAWRMDNSPPHRIPWNFPPAAAAVIDLMGAPVAITGAGLELQEDPIYILWNSPDPSPLETALSALTHTNAPPDRP